MKNVKKQLSNFNQLCNDLSGSFVNFKFPFLNKQILATLLVNFKMYHHHNFQNIFLGNSTVFFIIFIHRSKTERFSALSGRICTGVFTQEARRPKSLLCNIWSVLVDLCIVMLNLAYAPPMGILKDYLTICITCRQVIWWDMVTAVLPT